MGLEQQEKIIVLDFGGQYNQLIARRVRDEGVYAEVYASDIDLDKLKAMQPKGLIFTGDRSPYSKRRASTSIRRCLSSAFRFSASATAHS